MSPQERDQQHFVHKIDKLNCVIVIHGKQHCESNTKLPIQPLATSPNQCGYFTAQNEMLAVLANYIGMAKQTNCNKTAVKFLTL